MSEQPQQYGDGVKSPQEIHDENLADPGIPAIQAEVMAEVGPQSVKTVKVALPTGVDIDVPMQTTWRASAMDAMRMGDFQAWASKVLTGDALDDWYDWYDTDPSLGELNDFFEAVGKATGQAAGNRASRRQSARTRTR